MPRSRTKKGSVTEAQICDGAQAAFFAAFFTPCYIFHELQKKAVFFPVDLINELINSSAGPKCFYADWSGEPYMSIPHEDTMALLVRWLRELDDTDRDEYGRFGYDVYLPALVMKFLRKERKMPHTDAQREMREMVSDFYAPAWDLCRRGILRPGVRKYGEQATEAGNAGNGYSITPFGRQWLGEADRDTFVPTEPERFAEMLARFRERFGAGFQSRGQEAVRCYGAHAYLACCVMSGAAAESILLSAAIAKDGDEKAVLRAYAATGGRKKIEDLLFGQAQQNIREEYRGLSSLLKYWRDEAGHGKASTIKDDEAFYALAFLLRLALFMNDHWGTLTTRNC